MTLAKTNLLRSLFTRWSWLVMACLCASMAFTDKPNVMAQSNENSAIAVLQTRTDAIDRHLASTDAISDRLWAQINTQAGAIAEMQGEERAAFAILTLLTAGNFIVQLRRKKEDS